MCGKLVGPASASALLDTSRSAAGATSNTGERPYKRRLAVRSAFPLPSISSPFVAGRPWSAWPALPPRWFCLVPSALHPVNTSGFALLGTLPSWSRGSLLSQVPS